MCAYICYYFDIYVCIYMYIYTHRCIYENPAVLVIMLLFYLYPKLYLASKNSFSNKINFIANCVNSEARIANEESICVYIYEHGTETFCVSWEMCPQAETSVQRHHMGRACWRGFIWCFQTALGSVSQETFLVFFYFFLLFFMF